MALALTSVFSCLMETTCLPCSPLWGIVSGRWVYMGQLCESEGLGGREGSGVGLFQGGSQRTLAQEAPFLQGKARVRASSALVFTDWG